MGNDRPWNVAHPHTAVEQSTGTWHCPFNHYSLTRLGDCEGHSRERLQLLKMTCSPQTQLRSHWNWPTATDSPSGCRPPTCPASMSWCGQLTPLQAFLGHGPQFTVVMVPWTLPPPIHYCGGCHRIAKGLLTWKSNGVDEYYCSSRWFYGNLTSANEAGETALCDQLVFCVASVCKPELKNLWLRQKGKGYSWCL